MIQTTTHIDYTLFTPAEAAAMTGVSHPLQRKWRERGFLRHGRAGHGRLDLTQVAELALLRRLDTVGIGPGVASRFAGVAAPSIAMHTYWHPDAYDDPHGVVGRMMAGREPLFFGGDATPNGLPRRYLVVGEGGEHAELVDDVTAWLNSDDTDRPWSVVMVVVDLMGLATELVERASRPFAAVRVEEEQHDAHHHHSAG